MPIFLQPLKKYTVFKGRARRKEYWGFQAFIYAVVFAIGFVLGITGLGRTTWFVPAFNIAGLAIALPSLAAGVRRLHDTNHSGWWLLLSFVGAVFAEVAKAILKHNPEYGPFLAFAGALVLVSLACVAPVFVMLLRRGTVGENRFGPDPRDEAT